RVLFHLRDYPSQGMDILTLYAQGYSVVRFLVETRGRPAFLAFLAEGMNRGWDTAVQRVYGYKNLEDLEERWLSWLRGESAQPAPQWAGPRYIPEPNAASRATMAARAVSAPLMLNHAPAGMPASAPSQTSGVSLTPPVPYGYDGRGGDDGRSRFASPIWSASQPTPAVRLMPPVPTTSAQDGWVPVPSGPTPPSHRSGGPS
ncbi:MAG: hypothetical protein RMJ19_10730, partial [Gemmatales bacterium]|nr:hypothetical protein [Gemmatales bacterium]MDW8176136.1 hypothetical protein [Gemmatales bacterium]